MVEIGRLCILIQQTDQAVARYHVPVVLFDHGSGSCAAFAAYWLRAMGFSVQVALLDGRLDEAPAPDTGEWSLTLPVSRLMRAGSVEGAVAEQL